ncbi:DUF4331 domain-containing protein [Streptomyces sp. NBC_01304]|uniref:DUF4331 domain-containing protein n=1 Tax=Streptomyces sp. NBC_01304 TaxID=2903818 RepID=UPI002E0E8D90|nr:DUF4331 domain-containing protein [Streptomyces sp. NBC_01304]
MTVRQISRPAVCTALACTVLAAGWFGGPVTGRAGAASHVDSPSTAADIAIDGSDLYAFTSPEAPDTVTVAADYHALQGPGSPFALYPYATDTRFEIHADTTGDGRPEVTYRYTFTTEDHRPAGTIAAVTGPVRSLEDKAVAFRQKYTLQELRPGRAPHTLVTDGAVAPSYAGGKLMPDYDALRKDATAQLPGGGQTYVGQIPDSFFFNPRLYAMIRVGAPFIPPFNPVAVTNAHTMTLQLPKKALALGGDPKRNPVVGIWSTASRRSLKLDAPGVEPYVQVSRMGMPHFIETMSPDSLPVIGTPGGIADVYQTREPHEDGDWNGLTKLTLHPFGPHNVSLATGAEAPEGRRDDLFEYVFKGIDKVNAHALNQDADARAVRPAEMLRLHMGTPVNEQPKPYTMFDGDPQGFPNGRRFGDDIEAVNMRILMGGLVGVKTDWLTKLNSIDKPAKPHTRAFPYRSLPH